MSSPKSTPDMHNALASRYQLMKRGSFRSFVHLRETFPRADLVGKLTVFNIGGNKREYDTGAWKE